MAKSSVVTRLPDADRARLDFLIGEGKLTIDQLHEWLDSLGHDVSRSAIGRYSKQLRSMSEGLRRTDEITKALLTELGPAVGDGAQQKLLAQILNTLVFRSLSAQLESDGEDNAEELTSKDFMQLARYMKDLAAAQRIEVDRIRVIKVEAAKEAAARAKEVMKARGISAETVAAIEHAVLGVDRSAA